MDEHSFIRSIHRYLPREVYRWKINDNFAGGVADAWYAGSQARHVFVEYKYSQRLPKRNSTLVKPNCSAIQLQWLAARYAQGFNVWVIHGTPEGAVIYQNKDWEVGLTKEKFIVKAKAKKVIADTIAKFCLGEGFEYHGRHKTCNHCAGYPERNPPENNL